MLFCKYQRVPRSGSLEHEKREVPSIKDSAELILNHKPKILVEFTKLKLIVLDTAYMTQGECFEIFPYGLNSSKRQVKGGCVYAGSAKKQGSDWPNDILLPELEKRVWHLYFMIQYAQESKKYRIRIWGWEEDTHSSWYRVGGIIPTSPLRNSYFNKYQWIPAILF